MADAGKTGYSSFGQLFCLFLSVVSLIIGLSSWNTSNKLLVDSEKVRIKQLESDTDQLVMLTSDEAYVHARFSSIIKTARMKGIYSNELKEELKEGNEKYAVSCKAFFYENGQLLKSFMADSAETALFSPMMRHLSLSGSAFAQAQRHIHDDLQKNFLPNHRLELIKENRGNLVRYVIDDEERFYFWDNFEGGFGIFIIAENFPDFADRFKMAADGFPASGAGDVKKQKFIPPKGLTVEQMLSARIKANISASSGVQAYNHLWFFLDDASGIFWCTTLPDSAISERGPSWATGLFYGSIIICFFSIIMLFSSLLSVFPGEWFCSYVDLLSIRARTVCVFSMASLFPVVLTILFGVFIISDKIEVIESSVLSASITAFEPKINIPAVLFSQKLKLARELREKFAKELLSEEYIRKALIRYGIAEAHTEIELRNESGEVLYSTYDRKIQGGAEAVEVFSRLAIKQHAPHRLSERTNRVTPAEIISESIIATDETGMAPIMQRRGNLWRMQMGRTPTEWYWDVYPELSSGPAFFSISYSVNTSVKPYLYNELKQSGRTSDSIMLATEINHRTCCFKLTPEMKGDNSLILAAALASFRSGRIMMRDCNIEGRGYWLVVKPEKNATHILVNLVSKEERLKTLTPLKAMIAAGGIMALAVSIFGALLITRLIITPLSDLDSALIAIKERQNNYCCPVRRTDELGMLAQAFNKVIEEMKDLEFGKLLQESLLPSQPIVPEGFDISLFTVSATDMAGDYHDTVQLRDGRIVIVLGDVTGHGVSASLAMAMAKATLVYVGNEGQTFPTIFMDKLNELFGGELKASRKKMTLVTVVVNPTTRYLEIDNAGQSFPRYYASNSQTSFDIELPSVPIGAMKRRKPGLFSRTMEPGDAIILYTDGIIECLNDKSEMYGYNRFNEAFENSIKKGCSADETIRAMMKELDSFRTPGPYPDDITLVIVRRIT